MSKKAPIGRPTLYDESLCDRVVKLAADGLSTTEIAVKLGVNRDTLYEWEKVHPDFSGAMMRARQASLAWWERKGREGIQKETKEFNSGLYKVIMCARFPYEGYRDSVNITADVTVTKKAEELTDDELAAIIASGGRRRDSETS